MNKAIIIAAALGTLIMSGAAFATDNNVTGSDFGTVAQVDRAGGSITLGNGDTYNVPFSQDLKNIKIGEKVQIWYQGGDAVSVTRS